MAEHVEIVKYFKKERFSSCLDAVIYSPFRKLSEILKSPVSYAAFAGLGLIAGGATAYYFADSYIPKDIKLFAMPAIVLAGGLSGIAVGELFKPRTNS